MSLLSRRRQRRIAKAHVADLDDDTTMDRGGAVRSVQAADVDMPQAELDAIWSAMHLERLARTYWWYLSRISLGLIRVHYGDDERAVVFLTPPFVLLRFRPPEYEVTADRGIVRWRIRDGLLVARPDAGYLEIDVQRRPSPQPGIARVHVEVAVAHFYPALARPFRWFYTNTQSRIHVIVTHGFLKRLSHLQLEESAVGRFAEPAGLEAAVHAAGNGNGYGPPPAHEDVTVGSTPWAAVAGLAAAMALLGYLLAQALQRRT